MLLLLGLWLGGHASLELGIHGSAGRFALEISPPFRGRVCMVSEGLASICFQVGFNSVGFTLLTSPTPLPTKLNPQI